MSTSHSGLGLVPVLLHKPDPAAPLGPPLLVRTRSWFWFWFWKKNNSKTRKKDKRSNQRRKRIRVLPGRSSARGSGGSWFCRVSVTHSEPPEPFKGGDHLSPGRTAPPRADARTEPVQMGPGDPLCRRRPIRTGGGEPGPAAEPGPNWSDRIHVSRDPLFKSGPQKNPDWVLVESGSVL